MAYNQQLADKIREELMAETVVEEKKMFRGLSFMVNNKLCISVGEEDAMFRIDPKVHDSLLEENGFCRTMTTKTREYKGYLLVDARGLQTKSDLLYWIHLALAFNKEAKAAKKKTRAKTAS
ncbi:MAG: TfoX/Sxy family protein [Bacteroidota bacterium]|nr:TfoX/Sxy family protein [Bacteroidota bacterium]